ncbi:MAG TPA: flagellar basal-body MS-ring/collar protein FliF [Conexibacter sp.]|nr:flagellar basal-body MS-ring/collar protein FliF [Conexibacter sp.]
MPLRAMLANVTPRGRIVLGAVALGTIVVLILLMRMASAPSYATLETGLDPAQTGKVTAALDQRGIGYELQNNGTAIAVDKGQTAQARIALASAGLPGTSQPGYELLDRQKLGTSNFQQQIDYQRALEGEIAKTIEQVGGVSGAQVQLVLPDREAQLFADDSSPATAAVLLSGSTSMDPSAVRGIAQLVTNSVPGLQTSKVTITDGNGELLWPTSSGGASGGDSGGLLAKQAAESRYDAQMASSLTAMLTRTLGADKAQVQVNADLDANQATQEQLTYGRRGVPLASRTDRETLRGGAAGAGGTAGTTGNTPAYAQAGAAGGNSNYRHETADDTFGVDKTITHTKIAPGAINGQQVSVLLDRSVPASAIPQIRAAVANAAGIDARRGDVLSVGQVAFARPPVAAAPSPVATYGGYLKYVFVGLATVFFLFFVTRQLKKREQETLAGEPTWLREIESPRTLAELERLEDDDHPTHVRPLRTPEQPARLQVEDLVERDPDRVAQQVRAWMAEDDK